LNKLEDNVRKYELNAKTQLACLAAFAISVGLRLLGHPIAASVVLTVALVVSLASGFASGFLDNRKRKETGGDERG
jgi:hypothetical protein